MSWVCCPPFQEMLVLPAQNSIHISGKAVLALPKSVTAFWLLSGPLLGLSWASLVLMPSYTFLRLAGLHLSPAGPYLGQAGLRLNTCRPYLDLSGPCMCQNGCFLKTADQAAEDAKWLTPSSQSLACFSCGPCWGPAGALWGPAGALLGPCWGPAGALLGEWGATCPGLPQ